MSTRRHLQDKTGALDNTRDKWKLLCSCENRLSGGSGWVGKQCCQHPKIELFRVPFHSTPDKCRVGLWHPRVIECQVETENEREQKLCKKTYPFLSSHIWVKTPSWGIKPFFSAVCEAPAPDPSLSGRQRQSGFLLLIDLFGIHL